jgi:putative ABC transport system permease protein
VIRWTLRSLAAEPGRVLGAALGVAVALTLVVFFEAVFEGESRKIVAYPVHAEADVWVMQDGVSNMHMATSMLWDWKQAMVETVEGVATVTPILYTNAVLWAGGRPWFSYVLGLEPDARGAGPWEIAAGEAMPSPGEALLPRVVARMSGLALGDTVSLLGRELTVAGLTEGTFSMANSVVFVSLRDLEQMMDVTSAYSYLLVRAEPGVAPAELARRIRTNVDDVNALPRDAFVRNDRRMAVQMGVEVIWIMSLVSGLVAALIVAFSCYTQVVHLRREFAVTKSLGFPTRGLLAAALLQAAAVSAIGLAGSVALGFGLLPWVSALAPQVSLVVLPAHYAPIALGALLVTVVAALLPAWSIARVDPMTVFRG